MNDLNRLRAEYEARKSRFSGDNRYSLANPSYSFSVQQRRRSLARLLRQFQMDLGLQNRILEIGCGCGGVLDEFQQLDAVPESLFGIDLLFDRLEDAHLRLPAAGISNADGQNLPFPADSFNLVLQYTAFSSVLDPAIKQNMASDMLRVLKHNGSILWYDFWWNPVNRQTRGIKTKEIKQLFQGCSYTFQRITLAPPIARRVIPMAWRFGVFLESLCFLNSHYLAIIHKR